jgi:hypothetical protein
MDAPITLASEYLTTLHSPAGEPPHMVDSSLAIFRQHGEGWARGPKLNGTLLPPTADWMRIMPGGNFRIDARMVLSTDDGALIYISYGGVVSVSQQNFARMSGGDVLTAKDMYFLITPTFQTAHEKYAWLNHVQAVGRVAELKGGPEGYVRYDVFAVR